MVRATALSPADPAQRCAYYTVGRLESKAPNMINRMEEAWAGALELSIDQVRGLVHLPENAEYQIDGYVRPGDVEM